MKYIPHIIFACSAIFSSVGFAEMPSQHTHMSQMMVGDDIKGKNADVNFVKGMIAHHQGAVTMSEQELQYGKDPQMRQLAQQIIKAQKKEIQYMQTWLQKNQH